MTIYSLANGLMSHQLLLLSLDKIGVLLVLEGIFNQIDPKKFILIFLTDVTLYLKMVCVCLFPTDLIFTVCFQGSTSTLQCVETKNRGISLQKQ